MNTGRITENAVFIIGAGHFGARAAKIICTRSDSPVFIVDPDRGALAQINDPGAEKIQGDGIGFLTANFHYLKEANTIVPALPVHLAYEWLREFTAGQFRITRLPAPPIDPPLPNALPAGEGSTLVSYADFLCPDDCPEPVFCTVTGERRDQPLYALLAGLRLPPFEVHIIRSRQLAPGLGGYRVEDLKGLAHKVRTKRAPMWIVGTACKCHGILTAFEVQASLNS